ncbi:sperm flagellar protein 1 isoform X2 [Anolis carolinensis]|uniref:sperm flagellar protein 1 isoform X2 n=1 Tax=Anolis carolinensis TaxID=28377 RepID=UPI002F2B5334
MAAEELDEEGALELYRWVDAIPLSRPKRNLARDFSDGVLVAEVVKFFFPKMVEMHNYAPANSTQQKLSNWGHLNRKVLNKLNFSVPEDVVRKVAQCTPGVVELVLIPLRQKIEEKQRQLKMSSSSYQNSLDARNRRTERSKRIMARGRTHCFLIIRQGQKGMMQSSSQNPRVGRDLVGHPVQPHSAKKQEYCIQSTPDRWPSSLCLKASKEGASTTLPLGQRVPLLNSSHSEEVLPDVHVESPFLQFEAIVS